MFDIIHTFTANLGLVIYVAVAAYVIAYNPRRPINQVFTLFALTYGIGYFAFSLLLKGTLDSATATLLLRGRHAIGIFAPTTIFHLLTFYFPAQWANARKFLVGAAYSLAIIFAVFTLVSQFIIQGSYYIEEANRYTVNSGPVMPFYIGYAATAVIAGIIILLVAYLKYPTPSLRQQIRSILLPTVLSLLFIFLGSLIIFAHNPFLAQFISLLLVLPGMFYAHAVLRYGSFTGNPISRRDMLFTSITLIILMICLMITTYADHWLENQTGIHQFMTTSLVVVFIVIVFPKFEPWILRQVDRWLVVANSYPQQIVTQIAQTLAEVPDPDQVQQELLQTVSETLQVVHGMILVQYREGEEETAVIKHTYGKSTSAARTVLRLPLLTNAQPHLITSVSPREQILLARQGIELIFPLTFSEQRITLLALGQKKNNAHFTAADLEFCETLVEQMRMIEQITQLQREQADYLKVAYAKAEEAKRLSRQVIAPDPQMGAALVSADVPLFIQVFGALAVYRNNVRVPDVDWGSEKAKGMLAYLIWKEGNGALREELSTAIWPDRTLADSANIFHVTLHNLRNVLELNRRGQSSYIMYRQGRYYFNNQSHIVLDCDRFEQLVRQGTADSLKQAIALYHGEYMADMFWVLPADAEVKRRQLELFYENALRRCAQESADQQQAEMFWQKLLVLIPVDMEANAALIRGYLDMGHTPQAQRQMQRWQQALLEMGILPTPQIEAIWRQVPK